MLSFFFFQSLSRDWFVASSHEFDENKKLEKHVNHLPAFLVFSHHPNLKGKGKGKGNLFYVKNTGSGCPSLPSQGLMIEVFDIHVKRKKKKI